MSDCDRCGLDIYSECHCQIDEMSKRLDKLEERMSKLEKAQALTELTKLSEELRLYE